MQQSAIEKVLWSEAAIETRVSELAREIDRDFQKHLDFLNKKPLLAVGLLKGAFVFLADLLRHLTIPVEADFVRISSYRLGTTPGAIQLAQEIKGPLTGRHVLIVEDIVDTGQTLDFLARKLQDQGAASVKFCVLVDKAGHRTCRVKLDYVGFQYSGDQFLVGYGLDYAERFRNLPYIATLSPAALQSPS